MNTPHHILLTASLCMAALTGCRTNPCGDMEATLPASLVLVGDALEDETVCYVREDEASLMFWGGHEELSLAVARAIVALHDKGWDQTPAAYEDPNLLLFRQGTERLSVRFMPTTTPRFGAHLLADSVQVIARRYDVKKR
jgi:hypothetical protein